MKQPKIVKHVLFTIRRRMLQVDTASYVLGQPEDREAVVFDIPMVHCSFQDRYSASTGWRFITDVPDESFILNYEPYYVAVKGSCELQSLEDVRKFYEKFCGCKIIEWVEIDI